MKKKDLASNYKKLINTRIKIVVPLILLTIIPYFSFIWVIAFNPSFFSLSIFNTKISIGILLGFLLILLIFAITLLYVYLANKKLEPLINLIHKND